MKQVVYLTFNDPPSGIFASQVADVCSYWREKIGVKVRLISFISIRKFHSTRRKLKSYDRGAIVLPMFPGVQNWQRNGFFLRILFWLINPHTVVCRGPFACALALRFKRNRRICFDARGAYTAELSEYNVVPHRAVKKSIRALEAQVIAQSDFRLAVSASLVRYWAEEFGYKSSDHVIVPCTLDRAGSGVTTAESLNRRRELGFAVDDIIVVYSGSNAGWQSFELLKQLMIPVLHAQPEVKLLMLIQDPSLVSELMQQFGSRIVCRWVPHAAVNDLLAVCDYGWLVREQSTTNKVASPVKYAEYLAAGLQVIISPEIGDFSELTRKEQVGFCISEVGELRLRRLEAADRLKSRNLVSASLVKEAFHEQYKRLLSV